MLQSLHGSPLGHLVMQNTYHKVKLLFYWPKLKKFVMACDVRKRCMHETVATSRLLQPLATPDQAWSSVSMDFIVT